MTFWTRILPLQ